MTQKGVETVLGRLATDEAMRRRFEEAPALALRELAALGIELSAVERMALESLDPWAVQRFAQALDARLQKAALVAPVPASAGAEESEEEDEEEVV